MAPGDVWLARHDGAAARRLLDELGDVYADAYGIEPEGEKTSAFRGRASKQFDRPGFALVTAYADDRLIGFAFGYTLQTGDTYWWKGLEPAPAEEFVMETGSRTFVLSEIEVRRAWQGKGVGRAVHDALLDGRSEERATLATGPDARAQPVYGRWGWRKVGRVPGTDSEYYSAYDLFVISLPIGTP
jgi:GNAT superfamily N-acetyltransferase